MSGDRRSVQPIAHENTIGAASVALTEARFVPQRYEPNYAYPLLILLHGRGSDEQQLVRSMPAMSWRNYVGLGLRGPETVHKHGQEVGFGWGAPFARPGRRPHEAEAAVEPDAAVIKRVMESEGPTDDFDRVEHGIFRSVRELRRSLHVHSERIFLVGCGEGAAVAYRMGLTHPDKFAGVVAINGWIPAHFRPLARWQECRDLKVLVVHGQWNSRSPILNAQRDVSLLRSAGLRVAFQAYPYANRLTSPMLSDVDTWLIHQCTADLI